MTDELNTRLTTQQVTSMVQDMVSHTVSSISPQEINVETLLETMRKITQDLENRKVITPSLDIKNDIKVSPGTIPVYRVSYKDQLNSVHFITGKSKIKTKDFTLGEEDFDRALNKAASLIPREAYIVDLMIHSWEEDRTRINIEYMYRPVIAIEKFVTCFTVAV